MAVTPYNTNILRALKWQQAQAPNITNLITSKSNWYSQFHFEFWSNWFNNVFNLLTCNSFGIMIWCIILNVPSQLFGLYGNAAAWAYGNKRQNYIWSGTLPPPSDASGGGNFAAGGQTTILNLNEARWALLLRYVALVCNGRISFINYMLNWIFNGGVPWNMQSGRYFYVADCTSIPSNANFSPNPTNIVVYRRDFQGTQQLYTTPRTNVLIKSQDLTDASWGKNSTPTVTNATTDAPDGTTTMSLVTAVSTSANSGVFKNNVFAGVAVGTPVYFKIFFKYSSGTAQQQLRYEGTAFPANPSVVVNTQTGAIISKSAGIASAVVTSLGNGNYLLETTASSTAAGAVNLTLYNGALVVTANYLWGGMASLTPGAYIATNTVAVTVTDYSINSSGLVTVPSAPTAGTIYLFTGSFNGFNFTSQKTFGVANGSATTFQLSSVDVYRTDWQGMVKMYQQQRTNTVANSATISTGTATNCTRVTTTGTAPDGSTSFSTITSTATAAPQLSVPKTTNTLQVDPEGGYNFSVSIQDVNSGFVSLQCNQTDSASSIIAASAINFDLVNGVWGSEFSVGSFSMNGFTGLKATLSNGWWRLSGKFFPNASATAVAQYIGQASSLTSRGGTIGASINIFGVQDCSGYYLPTTTTAVSATDYTINYTTGAVVFAPAPPTGDVLSYKGAWAYGNAAVAQKFGTGDGTTTAFTLSLPPGAVAPVAGAFDLEYRIGPLMGFSAQFLDLLNSPQYGIMPTCAGSKYNVTIGP